MRRLFKISIWGYQTVMSDYKIYKIIMEQSKKSNYDWLTSADELMAVCTKPKFNNEYAKAIKCSIVECYSRLYRYGDVSNPLGAYRAFNSLLSELKKANDENINSVCRFFLNSYIYRMTFWQCMANGSESFSQAYQEYRDNKINELMNLDYIEFGLLPKQISGEFRIFIEDKKKKGIVTTDSIANKTPQVSETEFNNINRYNGRILNKKDK